MSKTLIAYYSFSGATGSLARQITQTIPAALVEIVPEKAYAFDYNTAAKEARSEIERGFCPRLIAGGEPINEFDIIFIGTPNWFKSMAPPVLSFLRSHNFEGKTIIPFCTHGGGGFGEIENRIIEECHGAKVLKGLAAMETNPAQITAWLEKIGLLN